MKRLVVVASSVALATLLAVACGGKDEGTKVSAVGSCSTSFATVPICFDLLSPADSSTVALMQAECSATTGTWATSACPTASQLGTCQGNASACAGMSGSDGGAITVRVHYYSGDGGIFSGFGAAAAAAAMCTQCQGTWGQ